MIIFLFIIFFTNVKNVQNETFFAFEFSIKNIFPALFPFMVISSFFLYLSIFFKANNIFIDTLSNILGICKIYFYHIIIGSLCGFVSGAKMICEDFKKNEVSKQAFSNSIILSSNAGVGFVIGCVGIKIWGNISFGIFLFLSQIFIAFILNKLFLAKSIDNDSVINSTNKISIFSAFTKAVSSSASTIINVCAFVIFFSVLISAIASFFDISKKSPLFALLFVVCEFCQGSFYAVSFENAAICAFLSGFVIGFGGLCVHFQTFYVCENFPLNKLHFFIFKLIQGLLCGISAFLYSIFFKIEPVKAAFFDENNNHGYLIIFTIILFIFGAFSLKEIFYRKKF